MMNANSSAKISITKAGYGLQLCTGTRKPDKDPHLFNMQWLNSYASSLHHFATEHNLMTTAGYLRIIS